MRHLASIQVIDRIDPIEGKDRIALATVKGWHVIVQKADYEVGDKCVYIEIDSVLPPKPEFAFLESKNYRIKTLKMAGQISQGICFPLSILPTGNYCVDDDVTSIIGVKQYEPEMDDDKEVSDRNKNTKKNFLMRFKWYRKLVGKKKSASSFPDFIKKTDEDRIQNVPWMLEDQDEYIVTQKIDGCSGTFALLRHKRFLLPDKYEYIVCSRNLRLTARDNSIYWQVSDKFMIEAALRNMIGNREWVAIQGECVGSKIQGNKYKVTEPNLYVFNLIDPTGRKNSVQAMNICATKNLNFVPILDEHFHLPKTVDDMVAYADGKSVVGDTIREGVVVRSQDGKKSFKAVSNQYLLSLK